jgi:glycosyltransferase involved in cell wall biosynthesis
VEVVVAGTPYPCDFHGRFRPGRPLRFWAALPGRPASGGELSIELAVRFRDGGAARAELGCIDVERPPSPPTAKEDGSGGLIAICLATFDPDPDLLREQIHSLREQRDSNWICIISDDASHPENRSAIERLIADDPRFVLSVSDRRRGFYLNFERALLLAPAEAEFIALCDQDDVWYPDKLTVLRHAIGDAPLAYSDARLTDNTGSVLADSLWPTRRPNTTSLASVLVANSIPGASALIRADVARRALPFPQVPGWPFHDRWLPAVALSAGEIVCVDRNLYDYVQHEGAVLRGTFVEVAQRRKREAERTPSLATRWRGRFFYSSIPLRMYARSLVDRDVASAANKRRDLKRLAAESPATALRLAVRSLRTVLGRDETSGLEWIAASGLLWRLSAVLCSQLRRDGGPCDTAPPPINLWDLAPPGWG